MWNGLPEFKNNWALFLDVDGTLLDIAPEPDAVQVTPDVKDIVAALREGLAGAIALVSGRSLANLDKLFAPFHLPAAGQHGVELRRLDVVTRLPEDPNLSRIASELARFAADRPGILVEDKGYSIAVHYRQAPLEYEPLRDRIAQLMQERGETLDLLSARMAFDIKPKEANKGRAIEWLMAKPPFNGRVPVFVGDDTTDEDGFRAVTKLNGHAVKVGFEGETCATYRVSSPTELRAWLRAAASELVA